MEVTSGSICALLLLVTVVSTQIIYPESSEVNGDLERLPQHSTARRTSRTSLNEHSPTSKPQPRATSSWLYPQAANNNNLGIPSPPLPTVPKAPAEEYDYNSFLQNNGANQNGGFPVVSNVNRVPQGTSNNGNVQQTPEALVAPINRLYVSNVPQYTTTPKTTQNSEVIQTVFADSVAKIALDVNRQASQLDSSFKTTNVALGPVTIAGALALVLLASLGRTFDELAYFTGMTYLLDNNQNPLPIHEEFGRILEKLETKGANEVVKYAIVMFVQKDYPIRPAFYDVSRQVYKNDIISLDFRKNPSQAQSAINNWVSERTNNKIKTLFNGPPPANTNVIIASVLYFKALWESPFFSDQTRPRPFYINGRKNPSNQMIDMMYNAGDFPYFKDRDYNIEILGFPYQGKRTTMYVILPQDSDAERLQNLEQFLTPDYINRLINSTRYKDCIVGFPKMKIESSMNLKNILESLNVRALFDPQVSNLGLISQGFGQRNSFASNPSRAPQAAPQTQTKDDQLIFSRYNDANCGYDFQNSTRCSRRVLRQTSSAQELDDIRQQLIQTNYNPGLYADEIIHKVFIDITESGTEAAAATGISLNRSGGRIVFRVDVPFIFFIYHEETKLILFWGSVKNPT